MDILQQMTSVQVYGSILIIAGLAVRLFIGKNRFERRGLGGLQEFDNYWVALIITIFEWLLTIASYMAIATGLYLLVIEWLNKH